jgi:hypothetical protein
MRRFSFHAKNIGSERYLTYIMGEGSELDEETLDFMEEESIRELVGVIFEQDDDYDYLTYDVSGKTSLEKFTDVVVEKEVVLKVLRNIALGLISCKDHGLHLSYILLHKSFIYIDKENLRMQFICLPVESEASVATEFKGFVRQLIANFKYDINGDLSYVGTLLAFINGDSFNLRNLVGLTEALMEDDGIDFEEEEGISTEDGEVISGGAAAEHEMPEEKDISSFMMDLGDGNEALPEIGDDEEEEAEAEAVAEAAEEAAEAAEEAVEEAEEAAEEVAEEAEEAEEVAEEAEEVAEDVAEEAAEEAEEVAEEEPEEPAEPSLAELEAKAKELAEVAKQATRGTRNNAKVKVSRAALIQKAAHEAEVIEETGELGTTEMLAKEVNEVSRVSKNAKEKKNVVTEDINTLNPTDLVAAEGETEPEDKKASISAIKVNPYLIRETTEERTMITKNVFKIGKANRGVDYRVSGNGAISRQHAIITRKDDGFYIRDNKSTNHTYVNGKELADGEEVLLKNNSTITLGDEEFIFKF